MPPLLNNETCAFPTSEVVAHLESVSPSESASPKVRESESLSERPEATEMGPEGNGYGKMVRVRVRKLGTCFRDTQTGGKGAGGRSHIGHMMACFMDLKRGTRLQQMQNTLACDTKFAEPGVKFCCMAGDVFGMAGDVFSPGC